MARPQFTIRRVLIAVAICAVYLTALGQRPPATLTVTFGIGLVFAGYVVLRFAVRLADNSRWAVKVSAVPFVMVAIALIVVAILVVVLGFVMALAIPRFHPPPVPRF